MNSDTILSLEETRQLLESWGLSDHARAVLSKEPEIVADLSKARLLEPFPPDYKPEVFEVLFDDLVFIRWQLGKLVYIARCDENYQPPFTEYAFDEETALFLVNGEVVVNRVENMKLNVTDLLKGAGYVS